MEIYPLMSPIGDGSIYFVPETDSTMSEIHTLVERGESSGVVVLTDYQRSGRGRLAGRKWHSPAGASLMFSAAFKDLTRPQIMPVRAGAAVARSLEALHGLETAIKWPNDVMVRERKIAGILCEYRKPWLYVGVGLNLFQTRFPPEIEGSATSLKLEATLPDNTSRRMIRDTLLTTILGHLQDQVDWRPFANARLWRRGHSTVVALPDGSNVHGVVVEIAPDGTLLVERDGGRFPVAAGELVAAADT